MTRNAATNRAGGRCAARAHLSSLLSVNTGILVLQVDAMPCRQLPPKHRAVSRSCVHDAFICVGLSVSWEIRALQVDAVPWEKLSAEDRATIEAMGVEAARLSSGGEP